MPSLSRRAALLALVLTLPLMRAADLPRKAPELVIHTTDGKQILLSQYKGKVVVVCFILTTCPHCQMTIGHLNKLQQEYGPRGFQVLASAIEQNAREAIPGFVQRYNPPFPVGYDNPQVAVDFMQHPPALVPLMPLMAFVDRQGNVRMQHEGDDDAYFGNLEENLRKDIEMLLKEGSPSAKKTSKRAPGRSR
jgi:peroxiredoxin